MDEVSSQPQNLAPCPICHRKFLPDRLQVHLRSCDKTNKYAHGSGYDNKAFLEKLDQEMAKESQQSTYKTSKKEKKDPNKEFLEKLDKELEKEKEKSSYVPSQPKKKEVVDPNKAFLDKLDAELKKEEQNPSFKKSEPKKKVNKQDEIRNDFMEKLEKELEKDAKNPYIPYAEQKKKLQKTEEVDSNKAFLEKLDQELKNEDKYKPSDKPKKVVKPNLKKDFEDKLNAELEKEKFAPAKQSKHLLCYLCFKEFAVPSYASHVKNCELTWRRNNLGKDPNALKPEKFDEMIPHVSKLTNEQIDAYNKSIFENKDKMTYVPCENCARNVLQYKMEEHLKTCKPMFHSGPPSKPTNQPSQNVPGAVQLKSGNYDLDKLIKEDQKDVPQAELVPCEKCGRKFLPDRLAVHSRGCKGKK